MPKEEKIRILLGVESFGGGVLRHIRYLATFLNPDRYDVHLITSVYRQDREAVKARDELREKGIIVIDLPIKHTLHLWSDGKMIRAIRKYIRREQIQIVHAHSTKAGLLFRIAARKENIPCVYTPHCFYFLACRGWKRRLALGLEKYLSKYSGTLVISACEEIPAQEVMPFSKNWEVIDNALLTDEYLQYDKKVACSRLELPDEKIIVGGVGRLCPQKNWELLIRAAYEVLKQRADVLFMLAGEGPDRTKLQSLIRKLNLGPHFRLLGYQENMDLFYSAIDIFVSTSLWEGLPYSYLEANHYSLPMLLPAFSPDLAAVDEDRNFYLFIHRHERLYERLTHSL
jgi:glycosyltransferase involved in cell wall biosynthesis